ncbi:MAG: hypothetical protein ACOC22_01930 [bacterium]
MDYFIVFFEDCLNPNPLQKNIEKHQIIRVNEEEMFQWIEYSKNANKELMIYKGEIICDLS